MELYKTYTKDTCLLKSESIQNYGAVWQCMVGCCRAMCGKARCGMVWYGLYDIFIVKINEISKFIKEWFGEAGQGVVRCGAVRYGSKHTEVLLLKSKNF